MPNQSELVIAATRPRSNAAGAQGVWAVVWFCTAGWMVSMYLTAFSPHFNQALALIAQTPWG